MKKKRKNEVFELKTERKKNLKRERKNTIQTFKDRKNK